MLNISIPEKDSTWGVKAIENDKNRSVKLIDNQAETIAEAVFELLNKIKSILFPFVWKSLGSSVISTQSMNSWFNQN